MAKNHILSSYFLLSPVYFIKLVGDFFQGRYGYCATFEPIRDLLRRLEVLHWTSLYQWNIQQFRFLGYLAI